MCGDRRKERCDILLRDVARGLIDETGFVALLQRDDHVRNAAAGEVGGETAARPPNQSFSERRLQAGRLSLAQHQRRIFSSTLTDHALND